VFHLKLWLILALAAVSTLASAQTLAKLLPQETIVAVGAQDLSGAANKFKNFQDEFNKLDVAGALAALFPAGALNQAENSMSGGAEALDDLSKDLEGLDVYDLVGQEAWLDLAASPANPVPAFTFVSKLSPKAQSAMQKFISDLNAEQAAHVQTLQEGKTTFYKLTMENESSPFQVVAYTEVNDLLAVSTNPNVLRGVLRRLNGSGEPSLVDAQGYQSTLGTLKGGNFYGYSNFGTIAKALTPLAQSLNQSADLKLDTLIHKLSGAFTTAGAVGRVERITDQGLETESLHALNPSGGDKALQGLLLAHHPADRTTLHFAPADALSYSSSTANLSGWWDYLNSLSASVPQLGGNLDSLLKNSFGFDLRQDIFSWAGDNVTTISTAPPQAVKPGAPNSNLLGNTVYIIASTDDAAASAGLANLFQKIGTTVSAMTNPQGQSTLTPTVSTVAGVTVTSYAVSSGINVSYAVTNGNVLIATSKEAMTAALTAAQNGQTLADQPMFKKASQFFPSNTSSISYTDEQASFNAVAHQFATSLQTLAGLGGSEKLNIGAVKKASDTVERFLDYVALRLGSAVSYSQPKASQNSVYSHGMTEVNW
jgi:hypothetical protein